MRTLGTGAIHVDTHTHSHTAVRWSWPIALDCSLWSPPHWRHCSYRSRWRQLHVTFLCSPPSYLSICFYVSFIHLFSLHFLISSFLLSPPPTRSLLSGCQKICYRPFLESSSQQALLYSTVGLILPRMQQSASHREHTQSSCSLWGMFLKLT